MTFEENYARIEHIPGWFSKEDCLALWDLMQKHEKGLVVEIGSFLGRSATFISALHHVICIDPWRIHPRRIPKVYEKIRAEDTKTEIMEIDPESNTLYPLFEKYAIKENEFGYRVGTIQGCDHTIWDQWSLGKIGLMHLDHEHSNNAVYNSLINWRRHMLPNAPILIHDMGYLDIDVGVARSMIHIEKRVRDSMFHPIVCRWKPTYA